MDSVKKKDIFLLGFAALAALVLFLLMSPWLLHSKGAMAWDEAYHTSTGVDQVEYPLKEVLAPIFRPYNASLGLIPLRALRNLLDGDVKFVFLAYKGVIFLCTILAVLLAGLSFSQKPPLFSAVLLCAFCLAPMIWLQANEIMTEPQALPFALILLSQAARFVASRVGSERPSWTRSNLALASIAAFCLLLAKFDFFVAIVVIASGATGLLLLLEILHQRQAVDARRLRQYVVTASSILIFASLVGVFWAITRQDYSLKDVARLMLERFRTTGEYAEPLIGHMNAMDVFLFGPRVFLWLYSPCLLLTALGVLGLWRSRTRLA